ncbi:hypothetical protein [Pseudobacteriovorax antillogorgiicola]|uniref:hypothetical protein n=1 Tax=Pseudobacteriovorax antillogorgiicola TaxID=1513793 RepID=UPI00135631F4|nr:hypothetical protein [Pseudobacteriovorax antillogorgiicola]
MKALLGAKAGKLLGKEPRELRDFSLFPWIQPIDNRGNRPAWLREAAEKIA